ncbi:MAG TPA: PP2C family serine/threonine-protein phosphatase [Casimicrobiaceae bacterium]|nr:PP2C family serine/threonine-protein phosphatase [Casimicrobiaceae bacterium]
MSLVTPREPALPPRHNANPERETATQQVQMATPWSRLTIAAATLCGEGHAVNEDSYSGLPGVAPVFVVADGVGGGALAAWASCQLVLRLHRALDRRRIEALLVRDALLEADRDIARGLAHRSAGPGAATVALCAGTGRLLSKWLVAWVGDCRAYQLRASNGEAAELLTRDDTYRNLGEEPPYGGSPDDPARMVGNGAVSSPNVAQADLDFGEALVLCSDGVHKHVADCDMGHVLREQGEWSARCRHLVDLARKQGSRDDATVLVVYREPRQRTRLLRWPAWPESQSNPGITTESSS